MTYKEFGIVSINFRLKNTSCGNIYWDDNFNYEDEGVTSYRKLDVLFS